MTNVQSCVPMWMLCVLLARKVFTKNFWSFLT